MRYQLRESARAPKGENRSSPREEHIIAHEKITSESNRDGITKSKDAFHLSENTSHNNTTIETITPGPAGLLHSPLGRVPPEMRLAILQLSLQYVREIAIAPKGIPPKDHNALAEISTEPAPSLIFTSRDPLANSCRQMRDEYANELKNRVFALNIPTLHLHVFDFDFSLVIRELLSNFTAAHRQYFNARAHSIRICLTITDAFTRLSVKDGLEAWVESKKIAEAGLKQWLAWREGEENAGRKVSVDYKITRGKSVQSADELESLRLFLLLFDPYSESEGELGDIVGTATDYLGAIMKRK